MTTWFPFCASGMFQKKNLFLRNWSSNLCMCVYSSVERSLVLLLRLVVRTSNPYSPGRDTCRALILPATAIVLWLGSLKSPQSFSDKPCRCPARAERMNICRV